jgi:hypothetical protein
MLAQILKQKTNGSCQYVLKHLIFEVKPPHSPNINPLDFYLWGHLKHYCISIENKEMFHHRIFLYLSNLCQLPRDL